MPVLMFSAWWCARIIKEDRNTNNRGWTFVRYALAIIALVLITSAAVVWVFMCFAAMAPF